MPYKNPIDKILWFVARDDKKFGVSRPTFWLCDICNRPISMIAENKKDVIILDHDWKTGKFRGWLCNLCNIRLGWFERRKERIEKYVR